MSDAVMSDIRPRLIRCFAAVFPAIPQDEIPHASQPTVRTWDSLATMTLVNVVEEEFQTRVSPVDMQLFVSFQAILNYLGAVRSA